MYFKKENVVLWHCVQPLYLHNFSFYLYNFSFHFQIVQLQHRRQPNMQPCRHYWELGDIEVNFMHVSQRVKGI